MKRGGDEPILGLLTSISVSELEIGLFSSFPLILAPTFSFLLIEGIASRRDPLTVVAKESLVKKATGKGKRLTLMLKREFWHLK